MFPGLELHCGLLLRTNARAEVRQDSAGRHEEGASNRLSGGSPAGVTPSGWLPLPQPATLGVNAAHPTPLLHPTHPLQPQQVAGRARACAAVGGQQECAAGLPARGGLWRVRPALPPFGLLRWGGLPSLPMSARLGLWRFCAALLPVRQLPLLPTVTLALCQLLLPFLCNPLLSSNHAHTLLLPALPCLQRVGHCAGGGQAAGVQGE